MKILLVDNTPVYHEILQHSLGDLRELELHFASNLNDALTLAATHSYCFYILAWQLPDGEGLQLASQLREQGTLDPIVILTASPSTDMALAAANAGVTEVFRKQDIEELITFVRRFIGIFAPIQCRILYVEDARDQRLSLAAEIRASGIVVDDFASADEAWEALNQRNYDLVLCDVILSGRMSGSRLINRIRRQSGPLGSIPILAASAFDNPSRRTELFYLGVDDYIAKPIVFVELRARIQTLLTRKRAVDRNNLLLQSTALGIVTIDTQGRIMSCNANGQAILGCSESALTEQPISQYFSGLDWQRPQEGQQRCEAVSARRGPIPVDVVVVAVDAPNGGMHHALLVRDLSEAVELERSLRCAKDAAEKAHRTKSAFLANMSHEIRTPLNGVLGMAFLAQKACADQPKVAGMLQQVIHSGKLLQGIIDDILDFSKIEAGKLTITPEVVDLDELLNHSLLLVQDAARRKSLRLSWTRAPELPGRITVDPLRLRQILLNLLSNAIKFTETGSVHLQARQSGAHIAFSVNDTGIGMTPEEIARIFQPFEQADSSITRRYGGTGLGLTICQRLAEMMHGSLDVSSQLGTGSCFTFQLPCEPAVFAGASTVNPREQANSPASTTSTRRLAGMSILVAEDNEINQLLIEDNLTHEGARVTMVGNGAQAVAAIDNSAPGHFDLVLMDVMMPIMDGYKATREILRRIPDLPVIGQTAHVMGEEKEACFAAGMVGHIAKPTDPETMIQAILQHLRPNHEAQNPPQ